MATLGEDPTRLGIFFFFDAQGIVDSYVETLLADMVKNLSELVIVVNGELTAKSYAKLSVFTDNIILRENKGLDVWAYKTGLDSYGWKKLAEFDEVVLFNATIMGPVYPSRRCSPRWRPEHRFLGHHLVPTRSLTTPSAMPSRATCPDTSSPTSTPTVAPW